MTITITLITLSQNTHDLSASNSHNKWLYIKISSLFKNRVDYLYFTLI